MCPDKWCLDKWDSTVIFKQNLPIQCERTAQAQKQAEEDVAHVVGLGSLSMELVCHTPVCCNASAEKNIKV